MVDVEGIEDLEESEVMLERVFFKVDDADAFFVVAVGVDVGLVVAVFFLLGWEEVFVVVEEASRGAFAASSILFLSLANR